MRTHDRGVQWRRAVAALALVVSIAATAHSPLAAQINRSAEAELEACLSGGKILKGWEELIGLTKPLKVELDCDGRKQKAVFKSLDVHKQGLYLLANGSREFNFSNCFLSLFSFSSIFSYFNTFM